MGRAAWKVRRSLNGLRSFGGDPRGGRGGVCRESPPSLFHSKELVASTSDAGRLVSRSSTRGNGEASRTDWHRWGNKRGGPCGEHHVYYGVAVLPPAGAERGCTCPGDAPACLL